MSEKRYIKGRASLGSITLVATLVVNEGEHAVDVYEKWKDSLLTDCGFDELDDDNR